MRNFLDLFHECGQLWHRQFFIIHYRALARAASFVVAQCGFPFGPFLRKHHSWHRNHAEPCPCFVIMAIRVTFFDWFWLVSKSAHDDFVFAEVTWQRMVGMQICLCSTQDGNLLASFELLILALFWCKASRYLIAFWFFLFFFVWNFLDYFELALLPLIRSWQFRMGPWGVHKEDDIRR